MNLSPRAGLGIFWVLFTASVLILSTNISGPLAPVISQSHLVCALLVGLTHYLTKTWQYAQDRAPRPTRDLGRTLLLIGLTFFILISVNAMFGSVPEPGEAPSVALQAGALVIVFGVALAAQAVAAAVSGQRVGICGPRAHQNTEAF